MLLKVSNVSVVVPIYNVECYLKRCIDSLINQTVRPLEIILVDDGSPDGSASICDEYVAKFDYIKVIHKENGGLSSARKAGWQQAAGDLICFVDSDDYVTDEYIRKLSEPFEDAGVDLSICAWFNDNNGKVSTANLPYTEPYININDMAERYILPVIGALPAADAINPPGFVTIRMYRTSKLVESDFVSEREYFTEDIILNISYSLRQQGKIAVINTPLYYYCINPGSLTLRFREHAFEKLLACNKLCRKLTEDLPYPEIRTKRLYANMVSATTYGIYNIGKIRNYSVFRSELKKIFTTTEVKQVFANANWPMAATWHKIIYYSYRFKLYFILYKLLRLRKTL